jgi:hypothetical protein
MSRRAGRKRRFRSSLDGDPIARAPTLAEVAAGQPHRRELPPELRLAAEAETPFGRLYLAGAFELAGDPERAWRRHEAGQRYRTIAMNYLASIGSPRDGLPHGRSYPCRGELQCGQEPNAPGCECRNRKAIYAAAFAALTGAGLRAVLEVTDVAVHGRACKSLDYLLIGLDRLAQHLLTSRRGGEY